MTRQKYEPTKAEIEAVVGVLFGGSAPWMTRQDVALQARDALIAAHAAASSGEDTIERVLTEYDLSADDVPRLRDGAIEAVAWTLLDLTSDLADRGPSQEDIDEARRHAESVFPALASPVQTGRSEAEIRAEVFDEIGQAMRPDRWWIASRAVRDAATEGSK